MATGPASAAAGSGLAAVRAEVDRYYSGRLERFGPTPLGVGWTCTPTQELRFIRLTKPLGLGAAFSINDIGCGYGALLGFLRKRHRKASIDYLGLDLSQAMVEEGRRQWAGMEHAHFELSGAAYRAADYCVASGVFNVKMGHDRTTWEALIAQTLQEMYASCRVGAAANFLLEHGGLDDIPEQYRCRPGPWIEFCKGLGAGVELHDNYGMLEFTLVLRRH